MNTEMRDVRANGACHAWDVARRGRMVGDPAFRATSITNRAA
jgi:hypothetical protein